MALCETLGMPALPDRWRPAVLELAVCHTDLGFVYFNGQADGFPDIVPLVDAGVWLLDQSAPMAAEHYVRHFGADGSPTAHEFVGRLEAALSTMSDVVTP